MERKVFNRIKVVLAEKRLTNKWLALKIGKTEATVCRWANNKMQPSIEQLFVIADALNTDVRALLNSNMKLDVMNPYDMIKEHYAAK
jgi:transcriptional regulator with XRE-family HTH domain